jgi:hypothetical protein
MLRLSSVISGLALVFGVWIRINLNFVVYVCVQFVLVNILLNLIWPVYLFIPFIMKNLFFLIE